MMDALKFLITANTSAHHLLFLHVHSVCTMLCYLQTVQRGYIVLARSINSTWPCMTVPSFVRQDKVTACFRLKKVDEHVRNTQKVRVAFSKSYPKDSKHAVAGATTDAVAPAHYEKEKLQLLARLLKRAAPGTY